MSVNIIKIGTRGSTLALAQTNHIIHLLGKEHPSVQFEPVIIKTSGDIDRKSSLDRIGGFGLFTKIIESELLNGTIDIAVHSAKDLPSVMTDGLIIGAVPPREDCRDVWLSQNKIQIQNTNGEAIIGTGSPRRRAQLLNLKPDLKVTDIRGNIETRLRKLNEGKYDALLMAAAGLKRINLDNNITEFLPAESFIPAPGQGALVIQTGDNDNKTINLVQFLNDEISFRCLGIERLLLRKLNAGCSAAVGGWARFDDGQIVLSAVVLDKSGKKRLYKSASITPDKTNELLVTSVTDELFANGAENLIKNDT